MGDYRPISLVGSIYKLLSKVLANRLKSMSEDLIGETQFAFCPGKQILDCSLISNELIDYTRKRGLQGIVFKADFRKAYDTVDCLSVNDLIGNPINFHFKQRQLWVTKSDWNPPDSGELKFNTDGAVSGSFGEAGIGGCLCNNNARCLITFSKSVGLTDATYTEILAIKEACSLFVISMWAKKYKLIIETDSKLAVDWMNPHLCPTVFKPLVLSCLDICKNIEWRVKHVPREGNHLADKLAKKGIGRAAALCNITQDA
ncbi:hypothetical protein GQ457_01G029990 [Hibiscus cannabinus]